MGDQQLPDTQFAWYDGNNNLLDLTAYSSPRLVVKDSAKNVLLTKTTGITLAASSPNYTIAWSAADITALTPDSGAQKTFIYAYATRTADSKVREFSPGNPPLLIIEAP